MELHENHVKVVISRPRAPFRIEKHDYFSEIIKCHISQPNIEEGVKFLVNCLEKRISVYILVRNYSRLQE